MIKVLKRFGYIVIMIPLIIVVSILSAVFMAISMTIALVFGMEIDSFNEWIMKLTELYNQLLIT